MPSTIAIIHAPQHRVEYPTRAVTVDEPAAQQPSCDRPDDGHRQQRLDVVISEAEFLDHVDGEEPTDEHEHRRK